VLLGFSAEFSGRRVDCEVMPRAQAEEVYETALAEGDAPALLEAGPDGLYTANIGNLAADNYLERSATTILSG